MSNKWWLDSHTTTGRGIFSQYNPDSIKETIERENRTAGGTRRQPDPDRTLAQLRELQRPPPTPDGFRTSTPRSTDVHVRQPLTNPTYPQYAHHHHYGWLPPTPERRVGNAYGPPAHKTGHGYQYGIANTHNQTIYSTQQLISTRKP